QPRPRPPARGAASSGAGAMSETRGQTPVSVLPELERMLVLQASRRMQDRPVVETTPAVARRRGAVRRPRIFRRWIVLAIVAALAVGGALAATTPWTPLLGNEHAGHPTVTQAPPSPAALRLLGVLRRAPSAADRDAQAQATLHLVGPQLHGVSVRYIRNLEADVAGRARGPVPAEPY